MAFLGRLYPYQEDATERMVDRGQMLLAMTMGCFSGDTVIHVSRGTSGFPMRLDDFVYKFNGGKGDLDRPVYKGNHRWKGEVTTIRGLCDDGSLKQIPVIAAACTGIKRTVRVTLASGKWLECTPDHELHTGTGLVWAGDLRPGDAILTQKGDGTKQGILPALLPYSPDDLRYLDKDGYVRLRIDHARGTTGGVYEHIVIVEKVLGRCLLPTEEVHHKNLIRNDNRPENLEVLSRDEHLAHHTSLRLRDEYGRFLGNTPPVPKKGYKSSFVAVLDTVVSIEQACDQLVYDVSLLEGHCLVANGFVAHNSGKTPTSLAAIEGLAEEGEVERCLVVVPASLKYQWRREINKFTDSNVTVIDGTPAKRAQQWRLSINSRYVVVNAETLIKDTKSIGVFQSMIVDEATIIKNRKAKRSRLLKRIGKAIPYRYALTGQPIENRPEELFSIMEFVDKDVLGSFEMFDRTFIVRDHFGKPLRYRNLDRMNKAMQECMVRKTREEIADQLPEVIPQLIPVPFDVKAARVYRHITNDLLVQIGKAIRSGSGGFNLWAHYNDPAGQEAQGQIMARLTVLRMLCDNPELIRISSNQFSDDSTKLGSAYAKDIVSAGIMDGVHDTPKLNAVVEYIREVLEEDPKNKVVLFSFFKKNLSLIQAATKELAGSVLFTGDMDSKAKDTAKEKFANDSGTRLFLSSDAGGYGVDLPMANYLISVDLPWSSGKLEQREARIVRLSSEFPHVTIATFVMQGSIEERMYEMLQQKRAVSEAFIDGRHQDKDHAMTITLDTLSNFLRESSV